MGAQDKAKVEEYEVLRSGARVKVEIFLAKNRHAAPPAEAGDFFADYAEERVVAKKLVDVRAKLTKLVAKLPALNFRPVIVIDLGQTPGNGDAGDEDETADHVVSHHNDRPDYGAGVAVRYYRADLSEAPSGKRGKVKQLARLHEADFELHVAELRERAGWGRRGVDTRAQIREEADRAEASARKERAEFRDVRDAWIGQSERVIPYSAEAWEGLRRVVAALMATRRQLGEILRHEEVVRLLTAASSAPLALPAPPPSASVEDS